MNDLLVVVPSRGRPENVERLLNAKVDTCRGNTTFLFGLDEDDPCLAEYLQVLNAYPSPTVQYEVKSGLRQVVAWVNYLAIPRTFHYRFLGTIGDDNVPSTEGWDVLVKRSLESQGVGMCFGDDLYPRPKGSLCCHVFMSSEIVSGLGYMGPPQFQHMVDPVWMEWGKATSIEFLPNVMMEHLHYSNGKSPVDQIYMDADRFIGPDRNTFEEYCLNGLQADVKKIRFLRG